MNVITLIWLDGVPDFVNLRNCLCFVVSFLIAFVDSASSMFSALLIVSKIDWKVKSILLAEFFLLIQSAKSCSISAPTFERRIVRSDFGRESLEEKITSWQILPYANASDLNFLIHICSVFGSLLTDCKLRTLCAFSNLKFAFARSEGVLPINSACCWHHFSRPNSTISCGVRPIYSNGSQPVGAFFNGVLFICAVTRRETMKEASTC